MKVNRFVFMATATVASLAVCSCENQQQKEERLAKRHCASCHLFPEPQELDKKTWQKDVFPQMAFRMGLNFFEIGSQLSEEDRLTVIGTLPGKPMVTEEELELIKNYYTRNAPDTILAPAPQVEDSLTQFSIEKYKLQGMSTPFVTMIRTDTVNQKIFVGTRNSQLYRFDSKFHLEDSVLLQSPPSWMTLEKDGSLILTEMGIMDPNDQAVGKVVQINEGKRNDLIDSLKRPVYFEKTDLNNDGLEDYVVCAFGNYTGDFSIFENLGDKGFKKHPLLYLPGARKTIIKDFDQNGFVDILVLMTQGDEQIILLSNHGNFKFRNTTLLRFPAVYGSSYFDIADFNNDGKLDILHTNGDNADYSAILKPYHGVRIFQNDGRNSFSESWFFPMHGASQALPRDFDNDGDVDIAVTSFFPDFDNHPELGFLFLENRNQTFVPKITKLASSGRWITMDASDFDGDGDCDLILGALDFDRKVPKSLMDRWHSEQTSLLVFRNNLR